MSNQEEKKENYTQVPNILFVAPDYKHLSKEEKFLYITLRSVYWNCKVTILALREIADCTNYSVGALSKMLPRLHDAGLIHAEVKREKDEKGNEKGNPKYHITIADIWELNRRYFSKTCSPNEHDLRQNSKTCSPNDTSLFTKCNKPVHQMNTIELKPELPKIYKDITKDKESVSPNGSTSPALFPEEELNQTQQPRAGKNPIAKEKPAKAKKPSESCEIPPLDAPWNTEICRQLFNFWRGVPLASYKLDNQSASYLSEHFSREIVTFIRDCMNKDEYWISHGGVDIDTVTRNINREMKKRQLTDPKATNIVPSSNILRFPSQEKQEAPAPRRKTYSEIQAEAPHGRNYNTGKPFTSKEEAKAFEKEEQRKGDEIRARERAEYERLAEVEEQLKAERAAEKAAKLAKLAETEEEEIAANRAFLAKMKAELTQVS